MIGKILRQENDERRLMANLAEQPHRRAFLTSAGSLAASAATMLAAPSAATAQASRDPASSPREPGDPVVGGYGSPSKFATPAREIYNAPNDFAASSLTPLAAIVGNITPSGLHFERHHAGIPRIDPDKHMLFVHGMVTSARKFSMQDLRALPSVTRKHFIECSGNTGSEWRKPTLKTVQWTHGLLSTSEWTGVAFATVARAIGLSESAAWVLAEGADACLLTRSIPLEKLLSDGLIAYGQNGEALRPEQGYPLRLIVPGYEGNTHIKWLRRLQIAKSPFMTREETSKYTDPVAGGKARQFTFEMDAKSVITLPSGSMRLDGPGQYIIEGLAWSGRGAITSVEVSVDGGRSWRAAELGSVPTPMCTVRFSLPWTWTGDPAVLQSRCADETGYVQPTLSELVAQRPSNGPYMSLYHNNAIQSWAVGSDGRVANVHV